MSRSKGYVDSCYLQAAAELLQPLKQHSYSLMRVSEGATVLDVGCGTGIDTIALASLVGPRGRVLGIDSDAGMVVDANERAKQQGFEAFVGHRRGAATALPFNQRPLTPAAASVYSCVYRYRMLNRFYAK